MDESALLRMAWDVVNSLDQPANMPAELWAQTRHDLYSLAIEVAWTDISNARRRGREPLLRHVRAKARAAVLRALASNVYHDSLDFDLPADADQEPQPPRELIAAETHDDLHEAVEQLPAMEQRVIRLRYWEYQTQEEVAALLDLNQPSVHRIETRALALLREAME